MSNVKPTDVKAFIADLGGGVLEQQLAHLVSEAALGTSAHGAHGKNGKVTLTLEFERAGDSDQLMIKYTASNKTPTMRGERTDKTSGSTPMYVNGTGQVTLHPSHTKDLFNVNQ